MFKSLNIFITTSFPIKFHIETLAERNTLLNKITDIDINILNQTHAAVTKTFLFGNLKYLNEVDMQILNGSIEFTLTSKRFDEPLSILNN